MLTSTLEIIQRLCDQPGNNAECNILNYLI